MSIPNGKLYKIKELCKKWSFKTIATRNQIQKLLGHLLYLHKCISPARLFTNRILSVHRGCPRDGPVTLNGAFRKDIAWFNNFLTVFNGTVKIHDENVHNNITYVYASFVAMGAIFGRKLYTLQIPQLLKMTYYSSF